MLNLKIITLIVSIILLIISLIIFFSIELEEKYKLLPITSIVVSVLGFLISSTILYIDSKSIINTGNILIDNYIITIKEFEKDIKKNKNDEKYNINIRNRINNLKINIYNNADENMILIVKNYIELEEKELIYIDIITYNIEMDVKEKEIINNELSNLIFEKKDKLKMNNTKESNKKLYKIVEKQWDSYNKSPVIKKYYNALDKNDDKNLIASTESYGEVIRNQFINLKNELKVNDGDKSYWLPESVNENGEEVRDVINTDEIELIV